MTGLIAITREIGPALVDGERTFVAREPIDLQKAIAQHAAYRDVLRSAGITVEVLPAADGLPDAVFVEDAAVVLDEIAVITRPGAASRRPEVAAIEAALAPHRELARIVEPGTLDGGDVLRIGRDLFVGTSTRTNREGIEQLKRIVTRLGYRVEPVAIQGCLHLKSAVTALDDGCVVVNPAWIDLASLGRFEHVAVAAEEPLAANTLVLNGIVHVSARCPATRRRIEARGFDTRALDLSELEKAEGALTCSSLIFAAKR